MPRRNLSVPHFRRQAALQSQKLSLEVQIAARKEKLQAVKQELQASKPPAKKPDQL